MYLASRLGAARELFAIASRQLKMCENMNELQPIFFLPAKSFELLVWRVANFGNVGNYTKLTKQY